MKKIDIKPIGIIHTPYRDHHNIPIQGKFNVEAEGWVEVNCEYEIGLSGLEGFSHAILLYHFFDSDKISVQGKPFLDNELRGIFSIRSPHRPNHIGLSVVKIKEINACRVDFAQVDMIDGTPLLDIKPYVTHFDCFPDARNGWVDQHFKDGQVPAETRNKKSRKI